MQNPYHYTECGLENIYLMNGVLSIETTEGTATSIRDMDGLHKAIGLSLANSKKKLSWKEFRFLRKELLLSQSALGHLFCVSEQTIRRWETGNSEIPALQENILRILYREKACNQNGEIYASLKKIADLEQEINDMQFIFINPEQGWQSVA